MKEMQKKSKMLNRAILCAAIADGWALLLAVASFFKEVPAFIPSILVGIVYYGYVVIAQKKRLHLLQVLSFAGIALSVVAAVMFAFFESKAWIMILFTAYGLVGFFSGIALLQLSKEFKTLVIVLSFLLMLTNGLYALIFLNPALSMLGFYISMPTTIIEVLFLINVAKKIK